MVFLIGLLIILNIINAFYIYKLHSQLHNLQNKYQKFMNDQIKLDNEFNDTNEYIINGVIDNDKQITEALKIIVNKVKSLSVNK